VLRIHTAQALIEVSPIGATALYEAVLVAIREQQRNRRDVPSPLVRDGAWHQVQVRAVAGDVVLRTRGLLRPVPVIVRLDAT
jgi:hypothetical protein